MAVLRTPLFVRRYYRRQCTVSVCLVCLSHTFETSNYYFRQHHTYTYKIALCVNTHPYIHIYPYIDTVPRKRKTPYSYLSDFQKFFYLQVQQYKWSIKSSAHLTRVAILPCELLMSENRSRLKQVLITSQYGDAFEGW